MEIVEAQDAGPPYAGSQIEALGYAKAKVVIAYPNDIAREVRDPGRGGRMTTSGAVENKFCRVYERTLEGAL